MVSVAELGNSATSVDDLIDKVFPNFQETVVESPRLMNGTGCIVTKPLRNVIEVKIAAGPFKMRVM